MVALLKIRPPGPMYSPSRKPIEPSAFSIAPTTVLSVPRRPSAAPLMKLTPLSSVLSRPSSHASIWSRIVCIWSTTTSRCVHASSTVTMFVLPLSGQKQPTIASGMSLGTLSSSPYAGQRQWSIAPGEKKHEHLNVRAVEPVDDVVEAADKLDKADERGAVDVEHVADEAERRVGHGAYEPRHVRADVALARRAEHVLHALPVRERRVRRHRRAAVGLGARAHHAQHVVRRAHVPVAPLIPVRQAVDA